MTLRKWTLDETYFDIIDVPEKAYWLGLLYADGHNNVKGNQITLTLKDVDTETVQGLACAVGSNAPIIFRMGGGFAHKSRFASCYLNSQYMCLALARHGCGQCKGNVIRFPFWLDKELWSHFVRGYFDGDGGFSKEIGTKHSPRHIHYRANIVSNPKFINDLNCVFEQELGRKFYVLRYHKHKYTTQLRIEGNRQVASFLSWVYQNAVVKMKRKYELFEELLNHTNIEQERKVYAYRVIDGSLATSYVSRAEAGRQLGVRPYRITRCCQHPTWTIKGYRFSDFSPQDSHRPSDALPIP